MKKIVFKRFIGYGVYESTEGKSYVFEEDEKGNTIVVDITNKNSSEVYTVVTQEYIGDSDELKAIEVIPK